MPPDTDRSPQANVTRIKLFRNQVYAHVTSTQVDAETFESLWQKISLALVDLDIPRTEIDDLKTCPLGPEEEIYIDQLKEWHSKEEDCKSMLEHLTQVTKEIQQGIQQLCQSTLRQLENERSEHRNREKELLQQLAKHNFKSKIARKVKLFHHGTREWLLKKVDKWFTTEDESRLYLLTAGPGFGKSVFAAKICELFKERGKFAACHFCDFSDSNLKDPMMMLQSLASQMCDNIAEFREKLLDQLARPHKVNSLKDAFQVYLQNPLDELEVEPRLIVIDGLDESATNDRSDLVKLIDDHFPDLPKCIKVLVTSRPEISVQRLKQVEMVTDGDNTSNHQLDLYQYLKDCLPSLANKGDTSFPLFGILPTIVSKCEGSFLYAFHIQGELRKRKYLNNMTVEEIISFLPQGMNSVYNAYFHRLKDELETVTKQSSDLFKVLEMLVAAKDALPLTFIARALDLNSDCRMTKKIINQVNELISRLLNVSDGLVTVFHKSVYDWLVANGYEEHEYTVKISDGTKRLWLLCETIFEEVKEKIVAGNSLPTQEVGHAFRFGHQYLLACNMKSKFYWFVDVIIMYLFLTSSLTVTYYFRCLWSSVLKSDALINLELRQRISWHLTEFLYYFGRQGKFYDSPFESKEPFWYWESILRYSPEGYFNDTEKNMAKAALLQDCVQRYSPGMNDMKPLLVRCFRCPVSAVGVSSNKKLVAVALKDGTVFVLSLPELVLLHEFSTECQSIASCTFAPDDSFVLFGKLETVLDIERNEEVSFFNGKAEQFQSCVFSPNGKRLATGDGSDTVKLWDLVSQKLLTVLCGDVQVDKCSFSRWGLFIIGEGIYANRKSVQRGYCVWSTITYQRVDERNLPAGKGKKRKHVLKTEKCTRCLGRKCNKLVSCTELASMMLILSDIDSCEIPYREMRMAYWKAFPAIYNEMDCILLLKADEMSLCVYESIHFTRIALWPILIPNTSFPCDLPSIDVKLIEENMLLYSDQGNLIVYGAVPLKDGQPLLSQPTRILWCSFSPDGTRLATCTSDGFIQLWNVHTCQVYQRFRSSLETLTMACCWCTEFLFVFCLVHEIPSLLKYPVVGNSQIIASRGTPISLSLVVNEFFPLSRVVEFSEGCLGFKCDSWTPVKVIDVDRSEHPKIITLPGIKSWMNIAVSVGASFILGTGQDNILWKRNEVDPTQYDIFIHIQLPFVYGLPYACCFSNDSKFAVIPYVKHRRECRFAVIDVNTGNGTIDDILPHRVFDNYPRILKVFCSNTVVIVVTPNSIKLFDLKSWNVLGCSYQRYLSYGPVSLSKLSPKGGVLAVPMVNGDMEFFRIKQFPPSSDVSKDWTKLETFCKRNFAGEEIEG